MARASVKPRHGKRPARSRTAGPAWWQPTLTTGKPDWREYLFWQIGLLLTAFSLLYVILLSRGLPVVDPSVIDLALLVSLLADLFASIILWYLIAIRWSRSKRFALAFLILADVFAKLLLLWALQPHVSPFGSWWFELLVVGTGLYLVGTGVIGLSIWLRGDDVSPWWKRR